MLANYLEHAQQAGVVAETDFRTGDPGQWLCTLADERQVDLIVMGRRDHAGIEEFLFGSVSNYVVHHAPCSVWVIQGRQVEAGSTREPSSDTTLLEGN